MTDLLKTWHWNSAAIYLPPLIATLVGTLAVDLTRPVFPHWFRWLTSCLLVVS